jgi:hypothetical protein
MNSCRKCTRYKKCIPLMAGMVPSAVSKRIFCTTRLTRSLLSAIASNCRDFKASPGYTGYTHPKNEPSLLG